MMLSGHKRVGAHVREWELPLNKRNSSSGRMMVSKRGVSHHAPDSRLRHARGDSWGRGRCPWTPGSLYCHVVHMIFDTRIVPVI